MNTVALLTDFGLDDYYVGVMKGVMSGINPNLNFIDINHNIPPGDISKAAYQLYASYRYFPEKTIFLVVVDPGVGTKRKAILVRTGNYFFVCPDNGVLTFILKTVKTAIQAVELNNIKFFLQLKSNTFHGRDLFSPVAAHLSLRYDISTFGNLLTNKDLVMLQSAEVIITENRVETPVIDIDRFGNIITGITAEQCQNHAMRILQIDGHIIPIVKTYGEIPAGLPLALPGSSGFLEISVNQGSAANLLNLSGTENRLSLHFLV